MENKINEVGAGVENPEITKQKAADGTATSETKTKKARNAKSGPNKVDNIITLENYLEENCADKILSQTEFLKLFPKFRFRYIHDVNKHTIQGSDELDLTKNGAGYGVFFTVNGFPSTGGAKKEDLLHINANFADIDFDKALPEEVYKEKCQETLDKLQKIGIPHPSIINRTQKGMHLYWIYENPLAPTVQHKELWDNVQNRLVHLLNGDSRAKDICHVLRVPDTLHLKDPSKPFEIKVISYDEHTLFTLGELDKAIPEVQELELMINKTPAIDLLLQGVDVGKGQRHGSLQQIAGLLLRDANTPELIAIARQNYYDWDKKVTISPESFENRKKELDDVFNGILQLELAKRGSLPDMSDGQYEALLNSIPKDTPKEKIPSALTPILTILASNKSLVDGEVYIRNKIRNAFEIKTKDLEAIVKSFRVLRKKTHEEIALRKKAEAESIKVRPLSEFEIMEAEKLLSSPDLLFRVLQMVKKLGVVGEEKNILLHYIILTSRLLPNPLSSTTKGDSSSGKSFTLTNTLKLFPRSAYIDLTDATPQSFFYVPVDHFKHKSIVIFEKNGSEKADYPIRTLQSEGKLKIQVTVKNPDTGQFEAQTVEKEGPAGFITTTTHSLIHKENDTRNISMFPDQSCQQTMLVYGSINERYLGGKKSHENDLKMWHAAQEILETMPVLIPFVECFSKYFPIQIIRTRRDYSHFLAVIEAVALLHQKQRDTLDVDGEKYIRATLADAYMATEIVGQSLYKSIYELPVKSLELVRFIQENIEKIMEKDGDGGRLKFAEESNEKASKLFTITSVSKAIGWDRDTIGNWIKPLTKKGYITIVEESKGKIGAKYKLEEKDLPSEAFLPSLEEMVRDNPEESTENIYNPITGAKVYVSTDAPTEKKGVKENTLSNELLDSVELEELSHDLLSDKYPDTASF